MTTPRNNLHFRSRLLKMHISMYISIFSSYTVSTSTHCATKSFTIRKCNTVSMLVFPPLSGCTGGVFASPCSCSLLGVQSPPLKFLTPSPMSRLRDTYYGYYKC